MVTMSADKAGSRRKPETSSGSRRRCSPTNLRDTAEDAPNHLVYKKMEAIVERMQDETIGVPVKTVKSFMTKIPSVFTGKPKNLLLKLKIWL